MLPECDLLLKQPSIKLRRLPPDLLHLLDEVVESLMKQLRADHSAHKPTQIMQPLTISCTVLYALMNAPTSHLEGWSNQPTGRKRKYIECMCVANLPVMHASSFPCEMQDAPHRLGHLLIQVRELPGAEDRVGAFRNKIKKK